MEAGYAIVCVLVAVIGIVLQWPNTKLSLIQLRKLRAEGGPSMTLRWKKDVLPLGTIAVCILLFVFGIFLFGHSRAIQQQQHIAAQIPSLPTPKAADSLPQGSPQASETQSPAQPVPQPRQAMPRRKNLSAQRPKPPAMAMPPTNNERSLVQNNSGGVNVQQGTTGDNSPIIGSPINVNTDRRITGAFPARKSPQSIVWISTLGDSAEVDLATNLQQALIAAGWDARLGSRQMVIGGSIRGIEVESSDDASQARGELIDDLNAAGLYAYSGPLRGSTMGFVPIHILIGGNP